MNASEPPGPAAQAPAAARSPLTLAALVLVCGLPFVAAWVLMRFPELLPGGHGQHGELFEPVAPLAAAEFVDLKGRRFGIEALQGKWTLAWLGTAPCDVQCDVPLGTLQRIRRALSEDANKAQVLGILAVPPGDAAWRERMQDDNRTRIIAGPDATIAALLAQLRAGAQASATPAAYFIIDPRGMLVLRYGPNVDYKDILADLRHLIRYVSQG